MAVKDRLSLSTSVTYQGAGDRGDWPWSTAGSSAIEHQPSTSKEACPATRSTLAGAATNRPGPRSAVNASHRIVDGRRGNYTNHASPADDGIVVIKSK
jgi:hypothetical protein